MITHEELKDYVSNWVHSELNEFCPYCDSPIETTNNLRSRMCSNKECTWKQAFRVAKMLEEFNIPSAKEKTCYKWLKDNNMEHNFEVFDSDKFKIGSEHKAYNQIMIKKTIPFYKLIEYLGIEGLGPEKAISEFGRFKNTLELIKNPICNRYFNKDDLRHLMYGEKIFNIQSIKDIPVIYVMLTRSIKGFSNRKHFITTLNNQFNGFMHFKEVGMVSYANALVSDNPSASNKVDYAKRKGIPLLTSEQFLIQISNFLNKNHIK